MLEQYIFGIGFDLQMTTGYIISAWPLTFSNAMEAMEVQRETSLYASFEGDQGGNLFGCHL